MFRTPNSLKASPYLVYRISDEVTFKCNNYIDLESIPPPSALKSSTLNVFSSSEMLLSMIVMLIVLLREPEANSTAPVLSIKSSGDLAVSATVFHWHFTLPRNGIKIKQFHCMQFLRLHTYTVY